nr:chemotaxis protein CheW [Kineosporia rhizophila]
MLLCSTGGKSFAVPLTAVRETMRPLSAAPFSGMPDFVSGVARIRGTAVPVVDSGVLTGGAPVRAGRWITLITANERQVALAVQDVTGIRTLPSEDLQALPSLLGGPESELYSAVSTRDQQLLVVLEASRLVPDELWEQLTEVSSS